MNRTATLLSAIAMLAFAAPGGAQAAPSPAEAMNTVRYLVGTWNCDHTVGNFSGTYRTSFAVALGGRWLQQRYDFPATATEPAWYGEFFLGYDERVPRWVRFGAMSTGQYFAMVSSTPSADSMSWTYRLPGGGSATWTKRSDREFAIDGPSYPENGATVTEYHVCRKAS